MADRDPWDVLDTPRSAGADEAKRAWRELVALYHPDHHADMPVAVQRRAAAGLVRVNAAWAQIRGAAESKADATPIANAEAFVCGNGLRVPADGESTFYVEGAPFDAKRRIKTAAKAANLTLKAAADNTIVLTKGSFSSRDGVVIDLTDNDGETTATITDGSPTLVRTLFDALRVAAGN
ncbi:MAG TPA: J domain-containing protein [Acidimicrobiales bacterium]|nr:J domain-containing protein [Acidimicrobiales bacterium]